MKKEISPAELQEFRRLFERYDSYAEVARRTGRSASTVRKYLLQAQGDDAREQKKTKA